MDPIDAVAKAWSRVLQGHAAADRIVALSWRRARGVPAGDRIQIWLSGRPDAPLALDAAGGRIFGVLPRSAEGHRPALAALSRLLPEIGRASIDLTTAGMILDPKQDDTEVHPRQDAPRLAGTDTGSLLAPLPQGPLLLVPENSAHQRLARAETLGCPVLPQGDLAGRIPVDLHGETLAWRMGDSIAFWGAGDRPPQILVL